MTIIQYIPQWLRNWFERPTPQKLTNIIQEEPKATSSPLEQDVGPIAEDDDRRYAGYRALWRL